jgi:hypothetical protein
LATQAWPAFFRQVPAALQVLTPVQEFASSALITGEQVPGVSEQDWQLPLHTLLQQTPSTHREETHSTAPEQDWPFFFLHVPEGLQVLTPVQVLSSAFVTVVQVPGASEQD